MALMSELVRRKVPRAIAVYLVVVWLLFQAADAMLPAFALPEWVLRILVIVSIAGVPVLAILAWQFSNYFESAAEKQARRVAEVEEEAKGQLEFPLFFQAQLKIVAERARLLMFKAQSRANSLYVLGTTLTVISVFAPVATIGLYLNLEPLPQHVVDTLNDLRGRNGEFPNSISVAVGKDWRILVSGVSFGLLFLAAAGALFGQHRRQMDALFQLGRDVDYFDAIVSAAEIRRRADLESLAEPMQVLVDEVIKTLLAREPVTTNVIKTTDVDWNETAQHLKRLTESIKELKT